MLLLAWPHGVSRGWNLRKKYHRSEHNVVAVSGKHAPSKPPMRPPTHAPRRHSDSGALPAALTSAQTRCAPAAAAAIVIMPCIFSSGCCRRCCHFGPLHHLLQLCSCLRCCQARLSSLRGWRISQVAEVPLLCWRLQVKSACAATPACIAAQTQHAVLVEPAAWQARGVRAHEGGTGCLGSAWGRGVERRRSKLAGWHRRGR